MIDSTEADSAAAGSIAASLAEIGGTRDGSTAMTDSVAVAVERLLREVPGVTAIYPSAPLPALVVGTVLATHSVAQAPPLVTVSVSGGQLRVTALIGVDAAVPAQATGRDAHDRIADYLASTGVAAAPTARVTVRIGMVG
ncbi:hypothetical protein [Subtercola sp. YIM 133946]|uniref:hypothetical protein n=1 Tax=Subtercola sp. YIM 133946 TaxID=3118909 RepID=UPI002F948521